MASNPYPNPRKRRIQNMGAAQRRSDTGPIVKQTGSSPQPTTGERLRKPPPRPLGTGAAIKGATLLTGNEGTNKLRPRTEFGQAMHPGQGVAARAGKKFKIGFTSDGRIVHLYGNDVPAAERRVVLPKQNTNLAAARRKRARG